MRIAYINDTYFPAMNGVIVAVENMTKLMAETHRVKLYVPAYAMKNYSVVEQGVTIERYSSVPVPIYSEFQIVMLDFFKFTESLDEFDPDIVHIHSPGVMGIAGLTWAKRRHKPVVATYHAFIAETLVYLSPYRLIPGANILDKGRSGMGEGLSKQLAWRMLNPFFNQFDMVLAPSRSAGIEAVKHGLKVPIKVLSNGMNVAMFPMKKDFKKTRKIIHVGRLGYEKNIDMVIKAFDLLVKKHPEYRLIIVGDGPARKDLMNMTFEMGISEKVIFTGLKKRQDMSAIYRSGELFVTASGMETQGLVILEAMLSGLPVVGFDKYAVPDLVQNNKTGYVVPMGKWQMLAQKMEVILENPELERQMGLAGRIEGEKHDALVIAVKLVELYRNVIYEKKKNNHNRK